jgi:hypothetical protein
MKTLTKILGTLAIVGALTAASGLYQKNNLLFTAGTSGLVIGGVGYVLAKSKEDDDKLNYK